MIRAQYLRIERGLSVLQLAEETGISRPTIARLERNEKGGSYHVMETLADYFGVQPHELLTPVGPVQQEEAA